MVGVSPDERKTMSASSALKSKLTSATARSLSIWVGWLMLQPEAEMDVGRGGGKKGEERQHRELREEAVRKR